MAALSKQLSSLFEALLGTQILIKRSATSGSVPSSLAPGELAMNLADGLIFWADNSATVQSTPLKNLVTQSQLTALIGGAPAALDTLKELADAINDDANFSATVTTALGNRLRVDTAAQGLTDTQIGNALSNLKYVLRGDAAMTTWSSAQAAQARFNLGFPTPLKIAVNTTLDPNLGILREYEFTAAATATAPAAANVFDGWRTGTFHNRGNGSITTATFVGTIGVPSGAYLDGVLNGTKTLAYGQKGYLYYDAQATPNATWRWVYTLECPLLLKVNAPAGTSSFDFAIPTGYQEAEFCFSNIVMSTTAAYLCGKLSANGGSTFLTSASAYNNAYSGQTGGSGGNASTNNNAMWFTYDSINGAGYSYGYAARVKGIIDLKYGSVKHEMFYTASTAASAVYNGATHQIAGASDITPNLIRFFASSGTMSLNGFIRGIPTQ